jgi:hypothetical protein
MNRLARLLYFSRTLDLTSEKERALKLPSGRPLGSVIMTEKQAARFSTACLRRGIEPARKS